jgi:hypothetical protein
VFLASRRVPPLGPGPSCSTRTDIGSTSNNNMSFGTCDDVSPESIEAWIDAPIVAASSGLIDLLSSLPLKYSETISWTFGILEDPPARTI